MRDVVYVRQEPRGQGAARNLGLRCAKGAYICTLDSDDLWNPDFIESSLRALRTLDADFVFSNWTDETPDGERHISNFEEFYGWNSYRETELNGWRLMEPDQSRAIYMEACVSPSSALLFSRTLISDGWSEDLKIGDDRCLLLNWVLSRPCRVAVSTQPRWIKRICGDNISYVHGDTDVKRYASIYDFHVLIERFSSVMHAGERAWYYAKIAFNLLVLCKFELRRKQFVRIPPLLVQSAGSMLRAFVLWPGIVMKCAREFRRRQRKMKAASKRTRQTSVLSHETAESQQAS